jgi:hypothetical protein
MYRYSQGRAPLKLSNSLRKLKNTFQIMRTALGGGRRPRRGASCRCRVSQ